MCDTNSDNQRRTTVPISGKNEIEAYENRARTVQQLLLGASGAFAVVDRINSSAAVRAPRDVTPRPCRGVCAASVAAGYGEDRRVVAAIGRRRRRLLSERTRPRRRGVASVIGRVVVASERRPTSLVKRARPFSFRNTSSFTTIRLYTQHTTFYGVHKHDIYLYIDS